MNCKKPQFSTESNAGKFADKYNKTPYVKLKVKPEHCQECTKRYGHDIWHVAIVDE